MNDEGQNPVGFASGSNRATTAQPGKSHEYRGPERTPRPPRQYEYEQRLAALESEFRRLQGDVHNADGPFQRVLIASQNGSNAAQWKEQTVQGTNIVLFQDGRKCDSGTSSGQILTPGSNGAFALLEVPEASGTTRAYFKIASDAGIWIKIGSATQDGSNKRWKYDWVEVEKTSTGYGGGWTNVVGGRSGHGSSYGYAYNGVEDSNGATGAPFGNGVASASLTGTFDIVPVPPNVVIVRAFIVLVTGSSTPEVWFNYENGIDGACS